MGNFCSFLFLSRFLLVLFVAIDISSTCAGLKERKKNTLLEGQGRSFASFLSTTLYACFHSFVLVCAENNEIAQEHVQWGNEEKTKYFPECRVHIEYVAENFVNDWQMSTKKINKSRYDQFMTAKHHCGGAL